MDEIGLTYLLSHPTSLGFGFARPIALILIFASAIFLRSNSKQQANAPTSRARSLRVTTFILVVLGIAGMRFTVSLPNNELALVAAVDVSGSIRESGLEWSSRYLRNLASRLAPGDVLSIVRFAGEPELIATAGRNSEWREIQRPTEVAATDLGKAIDHALTLYPHEAQKALLLVSDGNETKGESRQRIETLRGLGIPVHAVSPPNDIAADTRITKLVAPQLATQGRPLPVRVVVRNAGAARKAILNLYLDGMVSDRTTVDLRAGINAFDLLLTSPDRGGHVIRAEIVTEGDETPQNNIREVTVNIRQQTRVALATTRKFSALREVLKRRGFDVRSVRPRGANWAAATTTSPTAISSSSKTSAVRN